MALKWLLLNPLRPERKLSNLGHFYYLMQDIRSFRKLLTKYNWVPRWWNLFIKIFVCTPENNQDIHFLFFSHLHLTAHQLFHFWGTLVAWNWFYENNSSTGAIYLNMYIKFFILINWLLNPFWKILLYCQVPSSIDSLQTIYSHDCLILILKWTRWNCYYMQKCKKKFLLVLKWEKLEII